MTIDLKVTICFLIAVAVLLIFIFIIFPRLKHWYNHNKILSLAVIGLCCAVFFGVLASNYNSCVDRTNAHVQCIPHSFEKLSYDLKQMF
jgi:low affinity Fe/Cu permease